jgi:excisionase family DNA binding protein
MAKQLMELLTVQDVARITGWKESSVRQKCWRKELPYYKLNRSVRFKYDDIIRMIEEASVPALESR